MGNGGFGNSGILVVVVNLNFDNIVSIVDRGISVIMIMVSVIVFFMGVDGGIVVMYVVVL